MDPLFENYSPNNSLCVGCKENYLNLTKYFLSLGKENNLCMDVVDLVSETN